MLLKIVQGPNAGAEILLAEGMTLTLGKGDACDILLADQSLADVACELEVDAERVRLLLPGGAEERLDSFHVKFLGELTAIAVGPEKGAWGELVWPSRGTTTQVVSVEEPVATVAEETEPKAKRTRKPCRGVIVWILILLVFFALLFLSAICYWSKGESLAVQYGIPVEKIKPVVQTSVDVCVEKTTDVYHWVKTKIPESAEVEVPAVVPVDLNAMATEMGLSYREADGTPIISGNFTTRTQRLTATAKFYAAKPGVVLDLSDDESLRAATSELLDLVSEGKLQVFLAQNRTLEIMGFSPSASELRTVLEAIRADVPHVQKIDCSRVRLGEATGVVEVASAEQGATAVKATRNYRESKKQSLPKMPVVGVVTVPYPCLVLKDGSRVTEGAEFGGFIIEKISADTIQIRGPEGIFEWRP